MSLSPGIFFDSWKRGKMAVKSPFVITDHYSLLAQPVFTTNISVANDVFTVLDGRTSLHQIPGLSCSESDPHLDKMI